MSKVSMSVPRTVSVQSPGCCDHPKLLFKEGPNLAYTYTIQGKPATRGMLKFNETHEPPKPLCERELRKLAKQEADDEETEE
jgi:hypothetical protein